jgi:uncharacterized protein (TIGR03067 family)
MKALGLTAFAATFLAALAAQGGGDAALKKETAALQGIWKIVAFETLEIRDHDEIGATLEFGRDGKNGTFAQNDESKKLAFKLNPAGKPKEIDISAENEIKTMEGIYQIEKSTLIICLAIDPGDGRPTEFATKEGKSYAVITLEKQK